MKLSLSFTTILSSVLLATNVNAMWHPSSSSNLTWDYLLSGSDSTIKASTANVVTIDLEKASSLVPYLHSKGQRAICYFSGGTMQKSRKADYDDYIRAGVQLPETSSWGNHYIDIRNKAKLQPLIRNRMKRALSYGCDAVEVDSLGLYIHHIRDYTKEDTITFGKWLAETAHSVGISIGLKNVAGCAEALEPYFDFAVVESCADSPNVCNYYTKFSNHGKAVFIVHYGDRGYSLSGSSLSKLIKEAGNRKFICVISKTQNLDHNSVNYNCNTGSQIGSSGSLPKIDTPTTTRKTTTTVKKTTTVKVYVPTTKPVVPTPKPVIPVIKNTTTKQIPTRTTTKTIPVAPTSKTTPTKSLVPGAQSNPVVPSVKSIVPNVQANPVTPGTQANPAAPGAQVTPSTQANPAAPGVQVPGAQGTPAVAPGVQVPGAQGTPAVAPGTEANPAAPGAQANPAAPGVQAPGATQPGVSNVVPGTANKEVSKENEKKEEEEGGNGVGTAVAVVAAGGITAAAVAGFVFLKKNKKFASEKYDLGY